MAPTRRFPKPSDELIAKARRMWDEGVTAKAIGGSCKRSGSWVSNLAARRHWPKRYQRQGVHTPPKTLVVRCPDCYARVEVSATEAIPVRVHDCLRRVA